MKYILWALTLIAFGFCAYYGLIIWAMAEGMGDGRERTV
jgi:hypothetical protein